ncbi:MAG: FtsK/SpoIIIE domain-containing protein [Erysipelotrichaceae bacterium]|nr:FtsK/SpoIIIE domain-containing protein [Erysipelotrichaceae bacterium]
MFVIIEDKNNYYKYNVNRNLVYKNIEIYAKNKHFYISLKEGFYFSDGSKTKPVYLKEYCITNNIDYCNIYLYIYKEDKGINDFTIYNNKNIYISSDKNSEIVIKDKYWKDKFLKIENGNLLSNSNTLVNGITKKETSLSDGDCIEQLGLKIIYNHNFLYINNFNIDVKLPKFKINQRVLNYHVENNVEKYYFPLETKPLIVEELISFRPNVKTKNRNILKTIIPSIFMSFSMAMMAINNYLNNNQTGFSKIVVIVTPVCMAISTILVPVLFNCFEKRKDKKQIKKEINNYLNYIDDYQNRLDQKVQEYLEQLNSHYFSLLQARDKMFYGVKNSKDYMRLSLGMTSFSIPIKSEHTNIKLIDDRYKELAEHYSYINNLPLILDLEENRKVTICCKNSKKKYYYQKVLLELCYKHHFDDLNIAIFSNDTSLFNSIFNLPHLFVDNQRLTLTNFKQLQLLDQHKLNKPLVLFLYDKCEYVFSNPMIHIIYFSTDINDVYKNSDALIDYGNNNYLYLKDKKRFTYTEEIIDFNHYFSYLSKYIIIDSIDGNRRFSDAFKLDEIIKYYTKRQVGLKASFAYCHNEPLLFDLHESRQGPHGLVGGSTGSGKSELLISLLLSLCIRYNPEYLNIVLIDYKGAGLADSLSYNKTLIPHIVSTLSNLENNNLERLIIALSNECKYRQRKFLELSKKTNTPIMNIDDYLCHEEKDKIAHLLIVVDEFAELKKNSPEQIKELISISRIGRGLGIHLILATQKPSGVVDDEIISNSRFKIALKLFEEKDSQDIIKTKDAAYLSKPGQFIMRVDEGCINAQSIYAKNDINNSGEYKVTLLDNTLSEIETKAVQTSTPFTECSAFCKKIIEVTKDLNYKPRKIVFLAPKSQSRKKMNDELIIGYVDDYFNNKVYPLSFDKDDSILICSNRKKEVNSFINYNVEIKRRVVIIGSRRYESDTICDSLLYEDDEDILYLFDYLLDVKCANLCLIIEDYNCLIGYNEIYGEYLYKLLRRKENINLSFVLLTSNTQINFRIINSFKKRLLINVHEQNDLSNFFGMRSKYEGLSYFYDEEPKSFVANLEENIYKKTIETKPIIPKIPVHIQPLISVDGCLLGYNTKTRRELYYKGDLLITSFDERLLERYRKAYPNCFEIVKYNHKLCMNEYANILWLSSNINAQRLFIINLKFDLKTNEGIYIGNGEKIQLRIIDE